MEKEVAKTMKRIRKSVGVAEPTGSGGAGVAGTAPKDKVVASLLHECETLVRQHIRSREDATRASSLASDLKDQIDREMKQANESSRELRAAQAQVAVLERRDEHQRNLIDALEKCREQSDALMSVREEEMLRLKEISGKQLETFQEQLDSVIGEKDARIEKMRSLIEQQSSLYGETMTGKEAEVSATRDALEMFQKRCEDSEKLLVLQQQHITMRDSQLEECRQVIEKCQETLGKQAEALTLVRERANRDAAARETAETRATMMSAQLKVMQPELERASGLSSLCKKLQEQLVVTRRELKALKEAGASAEPQSQSEIDNEESTQTKTE